MLFAPWADYIILASWLQLVKSFLNFPRQPPVLAALGLQDDRCVDERSGQSEPKWLNSFRTTARGCEETVSSSEVEDWWTWQATWNFVVKRIQEAVFICTAIVQRLAVFCVFSPIIAKG